MYTCIQTYNNTCMHNSIHIEFTKIRGFFQREKMHKMQELIH